MPRVLARVRETVLTPLRREGRGASLDVSGEDRALALLRVGFAAPVDARILSKLLRAGRLFAKGEKALAQIHLAQLGLPQISAEQAFRLALADRLIANGFDPDALCKSLGFDLPAGLKKFGPDQPRDDHGRWTSGAAGVAEGRSISPGGPHGGDKSEDDKLDDFKSKFEEESLQADVQHGRPIDPLGPPPFPFAGPRPVGASGPKPADFVGQDFGKLGIGVEKPNLNMGHWTSHAEIRVQGRGVSMNDLQETISEPLLVLRQSHGGFYYLSDKAAVVLDRQGDFVMTYPASHFDERIKSILEMIHGRAGK
ncbi:hypothetical protein Msil_3013 [Methylocella silvestris BL2]|uniref:Uncharacterized protein n=1 Tax=Methylocella silvestris (strain DSM 15510 / CIP 108128 / LMG 27833 / NCIMB 13906 / BL2) TaxID=395965 RepID=B8EKP6_METSB|nr:hypothetical protein [Methylocella silvestris]ACK51924.1 hypothetical protein Msil_3013 [Methylocella silvestris BL2]